MAELISGITQVIKYNNKTYELIILYEDNRDYNVYARRLGEGRLEHVLSFENEEGLFEALAKTMIDIEEITNVLNTD